jgi:hypothetical protein
VVASNVKKDPLGSTVTVAVTVSSSASKTGPRLRLSPISDNLYDATTADMPPSTGGVFVLRSMTVRVKVTLSVYAVYALIVPVIMTSKSPTLFALSVCQVT